MWKTNDYCTKSSLRHSICMVMKVFCTVRLHASAARIRVAFQHVSGDSKPLFLHFRFAEVLGIYTCSPPALEPTAAWLSWCSFSIDCVGLKVSRSFIDGTRAGRITVTELLTRSTSTAQGAVRTGDKSTSGRTQTAGTAHSRSCRRS